VKPVSTTELKPAEVDVTIRESETSTAVPPQRPRQKALHHLYAQLYKWAPCCMPAVHREAFDEFERHARTESTESSCPRSSKLPEPGTEAKAKPKGKKLIGSGRKRRMSVDDFEAFLEQNAQLWAMLGVNLGLEEDRCKQIASTVAMQLYGRVSADVAAPAPAAAAAADVRRSSVVAFGYSMSREDFRKFYKQIVSDPKGQQHFFHQCVFAAYDTDGNGVLDCEELDSFLDVFYQAGSIFAGDKRLPDKASLRKLIYSKLDQDGDQMLSFDEIQSLISGSAGQVLTSPAGNAE